MYQLGEEVLGYAYAMYCCFEVYKKITFPTTKTLYQGQKLSRCLRCAIMCARSAMFSYLKLMSTYFWYLKLISTKPHMIPSSVFHGKEKLIL